MHSVEASVSLRKILSFYHGRPKAFSAFGIHMMYLYRDKEAEREREREEREESERQRERERGRERERDSTTYDDRTSCLAMIKRDKTATEK